MQGYERKDALIELAPRQNKKIKNAINKLTQRIEAVTSLPHENNVGV